MKEENLLGESSFISRIIAPFWVKRVYTLRRRQRDAVVPRVPSETSSLHERETLNEPRLPPSRRVAPQRLASRRLITHAITPQFAFRICRNAGKSRPACRMCVFRAARHVGYAFRSLNAISEIIFISLARQEQFRLALSQRENVNF